MGFKQQKLIFSQFSKLEVQGQGVAKFCFSWNLFPWVADGYGLSVTHTPAVSLCVQVSPTY